MKKFLDYTLLTVGALIVSIAIELILAPNGLVDGGTTALSIIGNKVFKMPTFAIFAILNGPILLFTANDLGKKFFVRALYANIITTIGLAILKPIPAITSSEVLIVIYGGFVLGLGVGLVVKAGGAVDGTEMLAIWANKHFKIPITTFLLGINAIIFVIAGFVLGLEQAMFSLVVFYIVTKMIDFVLDGVNQGKSVMIISDSPEVIGESLIKDLGLSITYLYGQGGYEKEQKKIIYCITDRFGYPKIKELVLSIDPTAILKASYVTETSGIRSRSFFQKTKSVSYNKPILER
jgi:uncharacterized membrane-anchored protein YitT (DUF2179 family)